MVRTTAEPPARPAVRAPTRLSRWVLLCAGAEAVGMTAAAGAARAATALAPRRTALAWGLVVAAGLGLLMGGVLGAATIAFYIWHRVNGIKKNRAILAQPDPVDPRRP